MLNSLEHTSITRPDQFDPLADLSTALRARDACSAHPPLARSRTIEEADLWWETVQHCSEHARREHLRWLGRNDLWFLLVHLLRIELTIKNFKHPWFFERCREVQDEPEGCLDFWSRGAGKSTISTYAENIRLILNDPNVTIGIFSHTRPIAKQFLRQIKGEFERNDLLKQLYPDVLWNDPAKEAPKWSEDDGIVVKRNANPKESTVEAWGLVDGMPTSKHFALLDYDDVISERHVTGPEMIDKVTSAWELSLNLAAGDPPRFRVKGTFYAEGDTYATMIERGFGKARIRPIVRAGQSLLLSEEGLALRKKSMSARNFALQILLDPRQAALERGFRPEWLQHWQGAQSIRSLNKYIFVDPGGKGASSTSYTALVVIGLGADRKRRILDIVRDRFSLTQRADALFDLHRRYSDGTAVLNTYYEQYSMQADREHIIDRQRRENYIFTITPVGGPLMKDLRIEKLQPLFASGDVLLPPLGTLKRVLHDGQEHDIVQDFINQEYLPFPFSRFKDVLDAMSRMCDPLVSLVFPRGYGSAADTEHWRSGAQADGSWMAN